MDGFCGFFGIGFTDWWCDIGGARFSRFVGWIYFITGLWVDVISYDRQLERFHSDSSVKFLWPHFLEWLFSAQQVFFFVRLLTQWFLPSFISDFHSIGTRIISREGSSVSFFGFRSV